MNKNGLFIVIDGIDGVGKTTIINEIKNRAKKIKGINFRFFKEPKCDNGYLYIANRLKDENNIRHYLSLGDVVIMDRYWGSTYAYNSEVDKEYFNKRYFTSLKPDYYFIVENSLDFVNKVLISRGEPELSLEKFNNLKMNYYLFSSLSRFSGVKTYIKKPNKVLEMVGRAVGDYIWKQQ